MVTHFYNPSYLGGRDEISDLGQSRQKHKILSEKQTKAKKGLETWLKW
jgi:hypothetical protein